LGYLIVHERISWTIVTYNTISVAREGSIEEGSKLFGQTYEYKFDYFRTRADVERVAQEAGYGFRYQALPVGF
jgi:hypothetical protein